MKSARPAVTGASARGVPRQSLRFGVLVALLAAIATGVVNWIQIDAEQTRALEDLTRRAMLLGHRVAPAARLALALPDAAAPGAMEDRLEGHQRLLGMALLRPDGRIVARGAGVGEVDAIVQETARTAFQNVDEASVLARRSDGTTHVLVRPVTDEHGRVLGGVAVLHDGLYLDDRLTRGMVRALLWSGAVGLFMFLLTALLAWLVFEQPLHRLAEWMRRLRFGNTPELPPRRLPLRRLADESVHLAASFRAARTKERESATQAVRSDKAWTRERLRLHALDALGGGSLVVVSNREPYMHRFREGRPVLMRPASGLVTGLDPILRACGGLWVAHGSGDADRVTADADGCVAVPPDDPRYTLRRVWISREEEQGYYYGFSNEGLWPLCHLTHERPIFRTGDWEHYVRANRRFADAVLEEIGDQEAVVLVQDYQLALVPGMLKAARRDLRVGLFWHIPWPNPEAFRICPFRVELLHGMLGADLVGFHLQQHCNNFLDTVDRMVEARLDWDRFSAELRGHTALVRPFPISVQPWSERDVSRGPELQQHMEELRQHHHLGQCQVGVGVDRIDYTKGIAERFRALERLFEKHPELRGRFTFVQLGAPSRTHIPRYRDLVADLEQMADAINWRFQTDGWRPIHLLVDHHDEQRVHAFLSMASICVVSSLHDGMNLVAKEFVAAKAEGGEEVPDEGVLVLSEFAGAARDLPDSLVVNPYDTEAFADALHQAVTMDPRERRQRMTRMRLRVEEFNVYRWAGEFLTALAAASQPSAGVDGRGAKDVRDASAAST